MIAVIDYNMGNVGSILNMLSKLGFQAKLTRNQEELLAADGLILPGVGAFDRGMAALRDLELIDTLNECALVRKIPVLGICLGMQLLTNRSEEGFLPGLGWIPGSTKRFRFPDTASLRIPHMGWNQTIPRAVVSGEASLAEAIFADTDLLQRYYYVHTYHVCCEDTAAVLATSTYGFEFTAAIGRGNIVGTQFHPEKSHRFGLKLMGNFGNHASHHRPAPVA